MLLLERSLYLLFTPSACRHDPWATLAAAVAAGVDLVQWRVPASDVPATDVRAGEMVDFERCRAICSAAGVPLIVNDDVMLALRSRAAGAHVGQDDMPAEAARKLLGNALLGVSTHDRSQIAAAIAAGADYLGFGPCFPTATKGYDTGQRPADIAAAFESARPLPVFAIGGITATNLLQLRALGVDRIAVSSAILASDDPAAATAALRRQL